MTKEEIMEAAGRCPDAADKPTDLGCIHCPLDELNGYRKCAAEFANYIRTKKEPASAATDTDSVIKEDNNSLSQVYITTDSNKCQAVITMITELADDIISDPTSDTEISAGYAGIIKSLCYALRSFIGGADNGRIQNRCRKARRRV